MVAISPSPIVRPWQFEQTAAGGARLMLDDGYMLDFDEQQSQVTLVNSLTNQVTQIAGPGQVSVNGADVFQFAGTTTFMLANGTKITANTRPALVPPKPVAAPINRIADEPSAPPTPRLTAMAVTSEAASATASLMAPTAAFPTVAPPAPMPAAPSALPNKAQTLLPTQGAVATAEPAANSPAAVVVMVVNEKVAQSSMPPLPSLAGSLAVTPPAPDHGATASEAPAAQPVTTMITTIVIEAPKPEEALAITATADPVPTDTTAAAQTLSAQASPTLPVETPALPVETNATVVANGPEHGQSGPALAAVPETVAPTSPEPLAKIETATATAIEPASGSPSAHDPAATAIAMSTPDAPAEPTTPSWRYYLEQLIISNEHQAITVSGISEVTKGDLVAVQTASPVTTPVASAETSANASAETASEALVVATPVLTPEASAAAAEKIDEANRDGYVLEEAKDGSGWISEWTDEVATQTDMDATLPGGEFGPGSDAYSRGETNIVIDRMATSTSIWQLFSSTNNMIGQDFIQQRRNSDDAATFERSRETNRVMTAHYDDANPAAPDTDDLARAADRRAATGQAT